MKITVHYLGRHREIDVHDALGRELINLRTEGRQSGVESEDLFFDRMDFAEEHLLKAYNEQTGLSLLPLEKQIDLLGDDNEPLVIEIMNI